MLGWVQNLEEIVQSHIHNKTPLLKKNKNNLIGQYR